MPSAYSPITTKHLEQYDSDCYIHEDDLAKLRGQSEEIDHEQVEDTIAHPKMIKTLCPRLADSDIIVLAE